MALFIFGYVRDAYVQSATISPSIYYASCAILMLYAVTIVVGRLYTGMHSSIDCASGVFLGVFVWGSYAVLKETIENWLQSGQWIGNVVSFVLAGNLTYFVLVPLTSIPVCLLLVHYHPQPVDDCPCFEDAIAFVSVILGIVLCRWHVVYSGVDERFLTSVMPGPQGTIWSWEDTTSWWALACAKVTVGPSLFSFPFRFPNVSQGSSRSSYGAFSPNHSCISRFRLFSVSLHPVSNYLIGVSTPPRQTTNTCQSKAVYAPFRVSLTFREFLRSVE
jgi:hypothetical protein